MTEDQRDEVDDPLEVAVAEFQQVAEEAGVEVLLIGAYARDLFLRDKTMGSMPRTTLDVDFAVMVDSWTSYFNLREAVLQTGSFTASRDAGQKQRVVFRDQIEIDLIPFGGVASEGGILSCWPEDFHQEMDVSGFGDALRLANRRDLKGQKVQTISPGDLCRVEAVVVEQPARKDKGRAGPRLHAEGVREPATRDGSAMDPAKQRSSGVAERPGSARRTSAGKAHRCELLRFNDEEGLRHHRT